MISPLALEPGVVVHGMTFKMQEWQSRMANMMQWQYRQPRDSFEWQKTQANIDAIHRAIDMASTDRPVTVSLLI